jgi:hypothetical protein
MSDDSTALSEKEQKRGLIFFFPFAFPLAPIHLEIKINR